MKFNVNQLFFSEQVCYNRFNQKKTPPRFLEKVGGVFRVRTAWQRYHFNMLQHVIKKMQLPMILV